MPIQKSKALVDKILTQLSNKYVPEGYISEEILPEVNVVESSGLVADYGNNHLRLVSTIHEGEAKYKRISTKNESTRTYSIETHGLSDVITEKTRRNTPQPFDAEQDTMMDLLNILWLEKEKALADNITDTGVITQNTTLSGTDQYSDFDNSDPLGDFTNAFNVVHAATGVLPNKMVMDLATILTLRYHPKILRSLGFADNRSGGLSMSDLERAIGVDGSPLKILVGKVNFNSAKEGQADVLTPVWGKNIVFLHAPATAAKRQTSLGYRFQFGSPRRVFKNSIDNPPNSMEILVDDEYDQQLSNVGAAFLIKDSIL